MNRCDEIRGLFSAYLEDELDDARRAEVREHLASCRECAGLMESLELVIDAGRDIRGIEPPAPLAEVAGASPCSRWLSMLFSAADHELDADALPRLVEHLETCPTCRRAWDDLTLIHQLQNSLEPPPGLAERCASVPFTRRRRVPRRIMGIRTATAAAYLLAILTTFTVGNPVTLARNEAGGVLHHTRNVVHHRIERLAADGRGELRLMVWRIWQWGERQVHLVRKATDTDRPPKKTQKNRNQGGLS